ncbi:tape measure protein [Acinetobacter towneri]|uniref:tape measure protein n=1 Tax=Acinetobacter towneri TaxID=202956 RepID=UPI003988B3AB
MAQESVLRIVIDSRNAERNARALANELGSIEKKGDFASKSMDSVSMATRQLAGYMAGLVTVGAAINKMDAYTNLQNRLKLVTNSQQELNQAMNDTFKIAQSSYQSWDSVVQVYQRFSDNAKTLGINMEQTAKLTETVSKAVAVSGASTQAAEAALTQFGQALASSTLRGEELNSILEQTPALAKAIAQGMGITVGQLRSVAAEGKITGEVLVDALTKSADSVDQLFQKTDITIGQSIGMLSNELTKFIGEAGQSSGAASLLAESVKLLAQNLSLIADVAVVAGIGYITKAILTKTVAVHSAIAATIRQTQAEIALTAAQRQKTAATVADTAAQNANNVVRSRGAAIFTALGGPIGAITIGVSALTAGYMYLQNRTAEANAKLEEQGKVANKTAEELRALNGVQRDKAVDDLAAAFAAQNSELRKLNLEFNGFLNTIKQANLSNAEAAKIFDDARKGIISQSEALERLNSLDILTPSQRAQGVELINNYEEARIKAQQSADAQKVLGVEVTLAGNSMQNAAGKARDKASAMGDDANATRDAAQANREYTASLQQKLFDQAFITRLVTKHNKTQQEANLLLEAHKKTNGQISAQDKELIAGITAQQKALENYGKVQSATSKARASATRSQVKSESAAVRERERLAQEQYQLREQIAYKYADRVRKIETDLAREIADIQKANFALPEQTQGFIQNAKNRADLEKELFTAQLRQQYSDWRATEEQKLDFRVHISELVIQLDSDMNDDLKKQAMQSLKDQANYELAQIKLAKEQRIFQAQQALYSEMGLIKKRYELERQEIARTVNDPNERAELLNGSFASQSKDEAGVRDQAISDYRGIMGYEESPLVKQFEVLDKMRELDLISEEKYQQDKLMLQTKYSASYMQSMLGGFMSLVDENSSAYAAMFAAQKAFAVAQALINIPATYSNTVNAISAIPLIGPYIAPAMGAAAAALQVAQAASIKSTNMSGFKSGGYTGNYGTNQVAGVVHGQEYVLNAEATKRVGVNTLNAINNGSTIQAEKQAQANARVQAANPQPIENKVQVGIFDDRSDMLDQMRGREGEKIVMYHLRRNGMVRA